MTSKSLLASIRNEVACINTALDNGGSAYLIVEGARALISSAETVDGALVVRLEEAVHEELKVEPSNVLPGGRGVWEQIEIREPEAK